MRRFATLLTFAALAFGQAPPAQPPAGSETVPSLEPGLYAVMNTSMGAITAKLFDQETPNVVRNFVALARGTKAWKDPKTGTMVAKPLYSNITFHRVIPDFMIQTGDPTGTGSHDCGFTVKDEIVPSLKYDRPGRLGLARLDAPNTGSCQFFITDAPYPSLDGQYTLFGQVVEGQDVVGKIARVPTGANAKPKTPVRLISVTIKRIGPAPAAAPKKEAPKK